jgi:hypothetical protein
MNVARCGHGEYDKGHCARPGCPNDWAACTECHPGGKSFGRGNARKQPEESDNERRGE